MLLIVNQFYRRGKSESGDIDALLTHPSLQVSDGKKKQSENMLKNLVDELSKTLVTDVISIGDTKFMVSSKCCANIKWDWI